LKGGTQTEDVRE